MLRSDTAVVVSSTDGQTVVNHYCQLPHGALVCERTTTDSAPGSGMIVVVHGASHAPPAPGHRGAVGQRHRRRGARG
jgi:hypothetical protein